jgi:glutathione S-transferase
VTPTLITIPFSHYCEKARWALEHARVPFVESAHLPGLHRRATARVGGTSVPVLVTSERTLYQSTDIVRFADERATDARRLYPDAHRKTIDEAMELFDRELGPATRLIAYHYLLPSPAELVRTVGGAMSAARRLQMRVLLPLVRPLMRKRMRITAENAKRAESIVRKVMADVSDSLEDGYLVGGRFTAADLTFAALAAPAVLPRGHAHYVDDPAGLPPPLREMLDEARATVAGKHAMAMYERHRI